MGEVVAGDGVSDVLGWVDVRKKLDRAALVWMEGAGLRRV
jgi:hypothetical protein